MSNEELAFQQSGQNLEGAKPSHALYRALILAFCSVQFLALSGMLLISPDLFAGALRSGYVSPLGLLASFVFSFGLMLGGILFFLSRRTSLFLLCAYVPYQLYWVLYAPHALDRALAIASLVCLALCLAHGFRLKRRGLLK
ncbi:MAG: hypothetical protein K0M64_06410 [Rhizobium sp.]|nr:hypothetical protein [Rhizobium sp.]